MTYQHLQPAEHPDVIEIDNVIYIRTDAIPGQLNVENYNPGRDQWMAIGHNEVLQEIERIIEGIVMSDVRGAFEMVDKKLDCDRAWIAACKWKAEKNEPPAPKSQLERDGVPSFYVSTIGYPPCTHRLHDFDIPVWCRTADEASKAMDAICDKQSSPAQTVPECQAAQGEDVKSAIENDAHIQDYPDEERSINFEEFWENANRRLTDFDKKQARTIWRAAHKSLPKGTKLYTHPPAPSVPDGWAMKKQGDSILVQLHENDEFIRGRWINQEDDPIVFEFMCAILKDTPEPQESSNE